MAKYQRSNTICSSPRPRQRFAWRHLPATVCVGAILATGCSATTTGVERGLVRGGPRGVVEAALRQMMHVSARFAITVQQLPSPGRVSSGTGVLDAPASSSEAVMNIDGGGVTEVRQVKGTLLLKSYNTPGQRLHARWIHLNEQLIPQVLKWPPEGM